MIRIGEFASIFDVSIKTVRLYEEKGLLKPAYIDNYTGYRYFDDNNIKEMTKILILKDLGLSLKDINNFNFNEQDINNRIKMYEKKINQMKNNINTLKSFLHLKEEEINIKSFVNDEKVIGKWKLIGISNTKENALKNDFIEDSFKIKELYLLPNGEEYWIIKWTKGFIYLNKNECPYEIIENKMLLTIPDSFDNTYSKIAIYEQEDNKEYTKEEIQTKDNTNLEFIEDKNIIGFWKSIDFVNNPENFNPEYKYWKESLYLEKIIISPDYSCIVNYKGKDKIHSESIKFTKNYFIDLGAPNTTSKYIYKTIKNKEYIIAEWKSGDYVYGKMINGYYVLERLKTNEN